MKLFNIINGIETFSSSKRKNIKVNGDNMYSKQLSAQENIIIDKKILNNLQRFLVKHFKNSPIEKTGSFLLKELINGSAKPAVLAYFLALIRLENGFLSESDYDQQLEKYLKTSNLLNYQDLTDFSDSNQDLNYLISIAIFQGWEIKFSISLFRQTLGSRAWQYISDLAREIDQQPAGEESLDEMAFVLATEIKAQENDFGYDSYSQDRSLQLHFEKVSFFLVIKRLMMEPEEGLLEPAGFAVHFCFLDAINQSYCINRRFELEENNKSKEIIYNGSTRELMLFLLKMNSFRESFSEIITSLS